MATAVEAVNRPVWWRSHRFLYAVTALLFVLPALINFAVFRYYPILWALGTSFWEYSLLGGYTEFVGLENYVRAFTNDPAFLASLRVTAVYALTKVPIQVGLALALAAFVNQERRGMGVVRTVIFIPVVTSYVVVSIVWGLVLNKDLGLLNAFLETFGLARIQFLTSATNALPTIIGITVWKELGFSVIILVAGMKGIPDEYYDAAIIDGANRLQRFFYVTLPLLRGPLMFVTVTTTLASFQVFIPIFQLTQGGPNRSTLVALYYIYRKAFIFGEMGYALALSMILVAILLAVSVVQMRLLRREND